MHFIDFEKKLQELKEDSIHSVVLVEGLKDKKALQEFGIENITTISKPLYQVVEDIANKNKNCILLTDLDSHGKKLYSILRKNLQKFGVKINSKFRNFLFKETRLTQIEGLFTHYNNLV